MTATAVADIDLLAARLLGASPCVETIPDTEVAPSAIAGRGLFARRAWAPGDVLGVLDGQVVDASRYPAVVDALEWNALDPHRLLVRALRTSYGFMNHSAEPNAAIDVDGRVMRACRPVEPGDELTLDYFAQPVPAAYLASDEAVALRGAASPPGRSTSCCDDRRRA